jgi:hypothetical protein
MSVGLPGERLPGHEIVCARMKDHDENHRGGARDEQCSADDVPPRIVRHKRRS